MTPGDSVLHRLRGAGLGGVADGVLAPGERLSLGVAARLSRYLQVLTQAKKMGKETISSRELSDYTHVNSTQIRRDFSGFGKFGKRGVGYNVDALVSQIRKILRTSGQHNIALFGAGHLGQAIASSDIFADHGFRLVAIFDTDKRKVGQEVGSTIVRHTSELRAVVEEEDIVVGVLAVPDGRRPGDRRRPRRGRREDHLQLLRGAAGRAAGRDGPHLVAGGRPALRAVLLPDVVASGRAHALHQCPSTSTARRRSSRPPRTSPSGSRRSSRVLDPHTLDLVPRFEELRDAAAEEPGLNEAITGELISSEIEIVSGRGEDIHDALANQRERRRLLFALAAARGVAFGSTGTHPWADYREQPQHRHRALPPRRRGARLRRAAQQHVLAARPRRRARRRPRRARCDRLRPILPLLLAASASSPFLEGHDTRLHSVRTQMFTKSFPRCGVPDAYGSWQAFRDYLELLIATGSIVEYTQVWWSVRPHATYGTIEVRIADAQITAAESDGLASLIVACVGQTLRDIDEGVPFDDPPPRLVEENMWRAIRYGMDGRMIDLRARGRDPDARRRRRPLDVDRAGARASCASTPRCRAPTAPSASGRPGQRSDLREVYADTVRETTTTYAQEVPA